MPGLYNFSYTSDAPKWQQANGGSNLVHSPSERVVANDFRLANRTLVSEFMVAFRDADVDGAFANFGGTLGWAIYADAGGRPGAEIASGNATPTVTYAGLSNDDELYYLTFAPDAALELGVGTFWLGVREGAWGTAGDGTAIVLNTAGNVLIESPHSSPLASDPRVWADTSYRDFQFEVRGITYLENTLNAAPLYIDRSVQIDDSEDDWDGGRLHVTGLLPEDRISLVHEGTGAGQVGVSGGDVSYGGVVIGSFTGGVGTSFTVTFNSAATRAGVTAVFTQLAYANVSDTPTYSRDLMVNLIDAADNDVITIAFEPEVLVASTDAVLNAAQHVDPVLVDLDGDGDLDLIYGDAQGMLAAARNDGGTLAAFAASPLPAHDFGAFASPALYDYDGDGDLDLVVANDAGGFATLRNDGGSFTLLDVADDPFAGIAGPAGAKPEFIDFDGDGDLDLIAGSTAGTISAWRNDAGSFVAVSGGDNPFAGISGVASSNPVAQDVDGDGDVDLLVGGADGSLRLFNNSNGSFVQHVGTENPLEYVAIGSPAAPAFGDWDGDGWADLLVGSGSGPLRLYVDNATRPAITIKVIAEDDPAVAADDAFATDELTVRTGNLLADNGSGADADPDMPGALTIATVNGSAANIGTQITLASGALLTVNANGTFSYDPNGAFEYVPDSASGGSNLIATDSFTYSLGGGDTGTVTIDISGVDNDDTVQGSPGNDILNGGVGTNILSYANATSGVFANIGVSGPNDTVGAGIDTVSNFQNLTGSDFVDELRGSMGANALDGGLGADVMLGWGGDDTYIVDDAGDRILEAASQGTDTVRASVSYVLPDREVENLVLTGSAAINGSGNQHANVLIGNGAANALAGYGGADRIDGGGGADVMAGGLGDDTYVVDNGSDRIRESDGQGIDTVETSVDYTLPGIEIERIVITGSGAVNVTGNGEDNAVTGNGAANSINGAGGDDRIDGGGGADVMAGGLGDDTFVVDSLSDRVKERANEGTDTVETALSFSLQGLEVENLTLTGGSAVNGTGNGLANLIIGNGAANALLGYDGADDLRGGGGNDALHGMAGSDVMTGGAGSDRFYFDADLGVGNVDTIADFEAGVDSIWLRRAKFDGMALGTLSADAFAIGSHAADASDRIVYDSATGALYFDPDGTGAAAAVQFATLAAGLAMTAADFTAF